MEPTNQLIKIPNLKTLVQFGFVVLMKTITSSINEIVPSKFHCILELWIFLKTDEHLYLLVVYTRPCTHMRRVCYLCIYNLIKKINLTKKTVKNNPVVNYECRLINVEACEYHIWNVGKQIHTHNKSISRL